MSNTYLVFRQTGSSYSYRPNLYKFELIMSSFSPLQWSYPICLKRSALINHFLYFIITIGILMVLLGSNDGLVILRFYRFHIQASLSD